MAVSIFGLVGRPPLSLQRRSSVSCALAPRPGLATPRCGLNRASKQQGAGVWQPPPGLAPRRRPHQQQQQQRQQWDSAAARRTVAPVAAAVAAAAEPEEQRWGGPLGAAVASVQWQLKKLDGLWNKFVPMSCLFFLMAFVNTIIDSLKDSLVITAVGGGTEVIPYLTVYAVLPSSLLFLVAYSWGTQRFSRERLFNMIIVGFLSFYAAFAALYPHHDALHLGGALANSSLVASLPAGLSGAVGMVRNWLFTLFYCASELWGDVVLSLLFWGLANETTSIEDAPLLYPLFGVGANLAQTMAGRVLRMSSDASLLSPDYTTQLQSILCLCLALGVAILALHAWISRTFPRNPKGSSASRRAAAAAAAAATKSHVSLDLEEAVRGLNYCSLDTHQQQHAPGTSSSSDASSAAAGLDAAMRQQQPPAQANAHVGGGVAAAATAAGERANGTGATSSSSSSSEIKAQQKQQERQQRSGMSMTAAFAFLRQSPQIRCLAVMALAQGITTNLLDLAWKHYLHRLASTPAAYSAFLGDTAMWTGIVTGTLMFASPMLFDRLGWRGVASVTPKFMLLAGLPFFGGCLAFNWAAARGVLPGSAALSLQALVLVGAVLQVFSRGAKFSLFKPAEEMVYIGLDDESRTKGKAAIDVVGAQSGKSIGSVLQQALLILSGGTLSGILPLLAVFYGLMLTQWTRAVDDLAEHHDPSHAHRISVAGSLDEEDLEAAAAAAGVLPALAVEQQLEAAAPKRGSSGNGSSSGGVGLDDDIPNESRVPSPTPA